MLQLHNLEQDYIHLLNIIEEAEGEITPEIETALSINEEGLEKAVTSYKHVMDVLDGNIDMANKEIERIKKFKEFKENAKQRFYKALLQALLLYGEEDKKGIHRLEFGTLKLSTRRTKSVLIEDEDSLDEKYLNIDLSKLDSLQYKKIIDILPELAYTGKKKISKTAISDDIKKNIAVKGASIQTKTSLTIK